MLIEDESVVENECNLVGLHSLVCQHSALLIGTRIINPSP